MQALLDSQHSFERLYNCSFYDYNSIPVDKRRNVAVGVVLLVLYVSFELLYLPCLGVFARKENRRESCYKLMLFMGLFSVVNIHSSGLVVGAYAVRGDVFCDRPLFNYLLGIPAFGLYCAESVVAVILALNRCIEMWDHRVAERLFDGQKVYYWMGASLVYGMALGFFTNPPVPNGMLVGWFFNPHIAYMEDTEGLYHNMFFTAHNICIGFGLPLIYAIFYLMMRYKMNLVDAQSQQSSKERRKSKVNVFLQVLLIGVLHMACTLLYVYMQYFPVPLWVVMSASYMWIGSQGLVPLIYITFNKYIRRSIKSLFIDPTLSRVSTRINYTITRYQGQSTIAPPSAVGLASKRSEIGSQRN